MMLKGWCGEYKGLNNVLHTKKYSQLSCPRLGGIYLLNFVVIPLLVSTVIVQIETMELQRHAEETD